MTEEGRPTTFDITSAVKNSNNRDRIAVGYTQEQKFALEKSPNVIEFHHSNETCKTSLIASPVSPKSSSTSSNLSSQHSHSYSCDLTEKNNNKINSREFDSTQDKSKYYRTFSYKTPVKPEDDKRSSSDVYKSFLSERKKKSLAKLVASKQIDKNVKKFCHHQSVAEEESVFCTRQNNTRQITSNKHPTDNFKNEELEHQKNTIVDQNINKITDASSLNHLDEHFERKTNIASRTTSFIYNNKLYSQKRLQTPCKSLSENSFNSVDNNDGISNHIFPNIIYGSDSDIKSCSNTNIVSSTNLVSQTDKNLPTIEKMAQDTFSAQNQNYEKLNEEKNSGRDSKIKLSGKEQLLNIHSQDEIEVVDEGEISDDKEEEFGGVYCGPKDKVSNDKRPQNCNDEFNKTVKKASTEPVQIPKSSSETNLSRNHSLKYSGGALHDDRNPLMFDHTFSQLSKLEDSHQKCKKVQEKAQKYKKEILLSFLVFIKFILISFCGKNIEISMTKTYHSGFDRIEIIHSYIYKIPKFLTV